MAGRVGGSHASSLLYNRSLLQSGFRDPLPLGGPPRMLVHRRLDMPPILDHRGLRKSRLVGLRAGMPALNHCSSVPYSSMNCVRLQPF